MHPKVSKQHQSPYTTLKDISLATSNMSTRDFAKQPTWDVIHSKTCMIAPDTHAHTSGIEYGVMLTFVDVNAYGAKIYCDLKHRYSNSSVPNSIGE